MGGPIRGPPMASRGRTTMTMTAIRLPEHHPTLQASHHKFADRGFRLLSLVCGLLVLAILALIAFFITNQAWPAFTHSGLDFFTSKVWDPTRGKFGALA